MNIGLNRKARQRAVALLVCIIIIIAIIVGGIIIYKIIKFCRDWLNPPKPPKEPDQVVEVQPRIYGLDQVPADQLPAVQCQIKQLLSASNSPCNGFQVPVLVPSELTNAVQVWVQRTTNLHDWEDITTFVYDPNNPVPPEPYCDTNAPDAMAFYRLRAWVNP